MRGLQQALPLERTPEGGRSGPRRRGPGGTASRQLSFGFDGAAGVVTAPPSAPIVPVAREIVPVPSVVEAPTAPIVAALTRDEDAVRSELEERLRTMLGVRVEVQLTRNRRTMISSARAGTALRLRLHRMFVEADGAIVEALGRYVKTGDRRASRRLGEFIEAQRDRFVSPRPPRVLRHEGEHHDLADTFARLEATFFPSALEGVTITWGRHGSPGRGRRRKRSIRLGTYTHDERLIRVHPVLDQDWVPAFFVEYIVFHEMLHHVEPAREEQGRTIFHTPEFRRRERAYPEYERAIAWERANISRLLS